MQLTRESIGKFIALGGTFITHQEEDSTPYRWPDVWQVPSEAIVNEGDSIKLPERVSEVKGGSELTAVIGEEIWQADEAEAWAAVEGFTVSNDVTSSGEWPGLSDPDYIHSGIGYKSFPTFSPIYSEPAPRKELDHYEDLEVRMTIDGETAVEGSTADFDFTIPEMIAHASHIYKLKAGDVVALGDPGNASIYLDEASEVTCYVESIGKLTNPITLL